MGLLTTYECKSSAEVRKDGNMSSLAELQIERF